MRIEKRKEGAQPGNSNAKKEKENRKKNQVTVYMTDNQLEKLQRQTKLKKWVEKYKKQEITMSMVINGLLDEKR